jgi:FMN phosphatase YigB (HAD superfamily)
MERAAAVRGVIFDLDGTLYVLPWMRLRLAWRLRRDLPLLRRFGAARRALRGREFGDVAGLREALGRELGDRAGVGPDRAAAWYEERFLPELVRLLADRARARPGLREALVRLRGRSVRLAVVSDHPLVDERLTAIGLDPGLFEDRVATEELGVLKPSALPFSALARKWGVEPGAVIVVGDRLDLDAASAGAAGMGFLPAGSWSRLDGDMAGMEPEARPAALHGENA